MGMFDESGTLYPPKIGEEKTITILDREKVENENHADNFKSKTKNFGYHYIVKCEEGNMILNNWRLFFALRDAGVDKGQKVTLKHVGTGEWEVTVNKEDKIEW